MMSKYQIKTISTQKLLKKFKFTNMGEYSDLYLLSDILLLTDVFEKFQKTCSQQNKLDPCQLLHKPRFVMECNAENDRCQAHTHE